MPASWKHHFGLICVEERRSGGSACSAKEVDSLPVRLTRGSDGTEVPELVT